MLRLKASHGTAQDRLALNRDRDPDRKINDLEKEWNMDGQDGQDLGKSLAKRAKARFALRG